LNLIDRWENNYDDVKTYAEINEDDEEEEEVFICEVKTYKNIGLFEVENIYETYEYGCLHNYFLHIKFFFR
jgi:hypothetical protein